MNKFIPLSVPNITGNEKKYVDKVIDEEWVSSGGPQIKEFENIFKKYLNVSDACACQSGTAGLHLCLVSLGIGENDIVLVPTLTFIATINAVMYQKATPVFFDCDDGLCIDVDLISEYIETKCVFKNNSLIEKESGKQVKAIIPVHVFGNNANMEKLMQLAEKYNLYIIEDATESLGSYYINGSYNKHFTGTIGHVGVFSFNGNKIITTGGGGMVVSNDNRLIEHIRYLSTQAKDDVVYFVHNEVGYNYRMTNLQAALGLGQMEQLEKFIKTKEENYFYYKKLLSDSRLGKLLPFHSEIRPNYWFYSLVLNDQFASKRDELISYLNANSIQSRPIWKLNHMQIPFKQYKFIANGKAQYYYSRVINIPCSTNLHKEDIDVVVNALTQFEKDNI